MRLYLIKKPLFPYSRTITKPLHTQDKLLPDHCLPSGMERGQTETGTWKSLPPIINWRWSSWCQRSSLGRWWEDRWDRCQLSARGQGLKPEIKWLDNVDISDRIKSRRQRETLVALPGTWLAVHNSWHASCLSACLSVALMEWSSPGRCVWA